MGRHRLRRTRIHSATAQRTKTSSRQPCGGRNQALTGTHREESTPAARRRAGFQRDRITTRIDRVGVNA